MKKLKIIFCLLLLSFFVTGQFSMTVSAMPATSGHSKNDPGLSRGPLSATLTGPTSVCLNEPGNVYSTDPGQTNYVWTVTGGTITAGGNGNYTATVTWTSAGTKNISVTYDGTTPTSLPVVVNPITASISIAVSPNDTVPAGTPVTFTATPVNGGTSPSYQWRVNGLNAGTNSPVFTYTPLHGDAVYCLLTSNAPCVTSFFTSNLISMTVNTSPLLVTVSTKTATPGQVITFPVKVKGATTTPISGANLQLTYDPAVLAYDTLINFYSVMPSTQWYFSGENGTVAANWQEPSLLTLSIPDSTTLFEISFTYLGGTSALPFTVYEFTDANYYLITTYTLDGEISPIPPALTGPTTVCQSDGNVYTTDAGQSNYIWTVSGGTITAGGSTSSNTATVKWTSAGTQSISVTYNGTTTTELPVTVTSSPAAEVSIVASSNPVCAGTSVTFTATPVNGGSSPTYQWKKGSTNVGTNSPVYSYTPVNGDVITCEMTSSETCISSNPATSNSITMTVHALTSSISISTPSNDVYAGTSVTFTAIANNGGTSPVFQWKVNGLDAGTNSSVFTFTPVNGDAVYCILTPNAPCVTSSFTSNVITMTVTTRPVTVLIPEITALPGETVNIPVKIVGASSLGTPISGANLQITYDQGVLTYDTLINFYSGAPNGQWIFGGENGTVAANWQEPMLQTLAIPDSTTLFEIRFTYNGGTSALPFTVYEFTDNLYNLITTYPVDGEISSGASEKTLNLTSLFVEGLYAGSATMNPAMGDGFIQQWPAGVADHVTVELHNAADYSDIEVVKADVELSTTGSATVTIDGMYGASYYLTIKHRNSIETTSSAPVDFSGSIINYAFDAQSKAYGNNLGIMLDGAFVIYAGDPNQDGLVDGSDLNDIGNQNDIFAMGYLVEDINGDGLIDGTDLNITGNNNDQFIGKQTP